MNPIVIPKNHVNKNREWYYLFIKDEIKNYQYKIDNRNIYNIVEQIENNNNYNNSNFIIHNFLYFLYKLILSDKNTPILTLLEGGVPNSGIEFINKNTSELLGIFHIHLSGIDNSVIIWYPTVDRSGVSLKFEYHIHPSDDYEKILSDIYKRDDNGYHFEYCDYFINLKKLLDFTIKENNILKFKDFFFSKIMNNYGWLF